jgi:hypothetical protein
MKTFFFIRRTLLLVGTLTGVGIYTIHAQTTNATTQVTPTSTAAAPTKPIGPAPANSPQHQILSTALSPQTRQTLQQAMDSSPSK